MKTQVASILALLKGAPQPNSATAEKAPPQLQVRKPQAQEHFRCRIGDQWCAASVACVDVQSTTTRTTYVIVGDVAEQMHAAKLHDYYIADLRLAVTLDEVPFLLPVRSDERTSSASVRAAVSMSYGAWTRIRWNGQVYEARAAEGTDLPEPVWPTGTMEELLVEATKDTLIASMDHPVIQRLRGIL